jgi:hypothetical protein
MNSSFLKDFVPLDTKMGLQPGEVCDDCKRDCWRVAPVILETSGPLIPRNRETSRGIKLCRECATERKSDLTKGYHPRLVGFHLSHEVLLHFYFGEGSCADCDDNPNLRGELVGEMVPPNLPRGFRMILCSEYLKERIEDYENLNRRVRCIGAYKYQNNSPVTSVMLKQA